LATELLDTGETRAVNTILASPQILSREWCSKRRSHSINGYSDLSDSPNRQDDNLVAAMARKSDCVLDSNKKRSVNLGALHISRRFQVTSNQRFHVT